jgi:hypothetical protein
MPADSTALQISFTACRSRFHDRHRADDGGPDPQPVAGPIPLRTGARSLAGYHPERMAQDSNLPATLAATSGFRPGTLPTRSAIHVRRAEKLNPMPVGTIRLATGPGAPVRFTLPAYPPRDSNPDPRGLNPLALPLA